MIVAFDGALVSEPYTVSFDGQTLTEGTITVAVDGQKVQSAPGSPAHQSKWWQEVCYYLGAVTNLGRTIINIDNELTQVVDGNVITPAKVTTELLYGKAHEFVVVLPWGASSGGPGLLPGNRPKFQRNRPDQPLGGVTRRN